MVEMQDFIILTREQIRELMAEVDEVMTEAYNEGFEHGRAQGADEGFSEGVADGYDEGYEDGRSDSNSDSYNEGYHDGYDAAVVCAAEDAAFSEPPRPGRAEGERLFDSWKKCTSTTGTSRSPSPRGSVGLSCASSVAGRWSLKSI
jgi:hypothetical protein